MEVLKPHSQKQNFCLVLALIGLLSVPGLIKGLTTLASAQTDTPSWSYTGSLNAPRAYHTATLLPDGKVLVAGGMGFSDGRVQGLDSAELYDPVTGKWNATGKLNVPRTGHTATLLEDGKVLIVGGVDGRTLDRSLNSAELYDTVTGTWSITGSLNAPRGGHKATLLKSGKVLVAGGEEIIDIVFEEYISLDTAELYDPATGTWISTGYLNIAGVYNSATLLQNGKVLLLAWGSA